MILSFVQDVPTSDRATLFYDVDGVMVTKQMQQRRSWDDRCLRLRVTNGVRAAGASASEKAWLFRDSASSFYRLAGR